MSTTYVCSVTKVGPSINGTETKSPVVYIKLTDTAGSFANQWFYASDGTQNLMLAVGLAAITGQKYVQVLADPPNAGNSPYTAVQEISLLQSLTSI